MAVPLTYSHYPRAGDSNIPPTYSHHPRAGDGDMLPEYYRLLRAGDGSELGRKLKMTPTKSVWDREQNKTIDVIDVSASRVYRIISDTLLRFIRNYKYDNHSAALSSLQDCTCMDGFLTIEVHGVLAISVNEVYKFIQQEGLEGVDIYVSLNNTCLSKATGPPLKCTITAPLNLCSTFDMDNDTQGQFVQPQRMDTREVSADYDDDYDRTHHHEQAYYPKGKYKQKTKTDILFLYAIVSGLVVFLVGVFTVSIIEQQPFGVVINEMTSGVIGGLKRSIVGPAVVQEFPGGGTPSQNQNTNGHQNPVQENNSHSMGSAGDGGGGGSGNISNRTPS